MWREQRGNLTREDIGKALWAGWGLPSLTPTVSSSFVGENGWRPSEQGWGPVPGLHSRSPSERWPPVLTHGGSRAQAQEAQLLPFVESVCMISCNPHNDSRR